MSDRVFDRIYPHAARWRSATFWTPVAVAMRAAELFAHHRATRVLDVGCGVGKPCIVGAARTQALFVGVDHREQLIHIANEAAARVGVANARFLHRSFDAIDIDAFDAAYFFNPFEENLWPKGLWLDSAVELSRANFVRDVARARRMLANARPGMRVVTYHGLGSDLPDGYDLVHHERIHTGSLELWIKA